MALMIRGARSVGSWVGIACLVILAVVAYAAVAFFIAAMLIPAKGRAEPYHSNPGLLTWIPITCCVTNDCCWQISESEVRPRPGDRWEVLATGQHLQRTDWSPDGKFYRCACDLRGGRWIRHQGANTRCIFVPMRSAGQ